ncbi:MAG: hypothetical protein KUG77_14785 [Nannocystaceae bacterium]|nr:hypothetical protein [Nannocystaceae bacterium]
MLQRATSLLVCGAAALLSSSAAAAPTQPGELVNDLFQPVQCSFCHGFINAADAQDDPPYSPFNTWQGTMMANAARDPVFWAGVAVAEVDDPEETEVCVRCHSPRAFLGGNGEATSFDELTPQEQEGIECEFCHRMVEDEGVPAGNAQYTVADVLGPGGNNVPRHGPWDFTDGVPEPPHDWVYDEYIGQSRFCGTCHDVTTPAERVDDDGIGMGRSFNEQRTYSEWLGSAYAEPGDDFASCQDCHMTAVPNKPGCSDHVNQFAHATGGRRHDFNGANRFMLELLRNEYGDMGQGEVPSVYFDLNIERMDEFLATAASLEVSGPKTFDVESGLEDLLITVTNNTGHKLPSGYSEGRVMWVEVVGRYGNDILFSSGGWNPADGLQIDPQLRTYEGVGEDYADGTQFHLLRNNHWVEDTRIPPLGAQPDIETDPVGTRYTLLPDGTWPNFDVNTYNFAGLEGLLDATPEDDTDDVLELTVRVRYLINTPEYISFLEANAGEAGTHVAGLFDEMGGATPTTLAEQVLQLPIEGLNRPGSESSSGSGTSTSSTGGGTGVGTSSNSTTSAPPTTTADTTVADESSTGGAPADGADDGCGCTQGGGSGWNGAFLLIPLLMMRRRRL